MPINLYLRYCLYITAGLFIVIFWLSSHVSDKKQLEMETLNASKTSSWGVFS